MKLILRIAVGMIAAGCLVVVLISFQDDQRYWTEDVDFKDWRLGRYVGGLPANLTIPSSLEETPDASVPPTPPTVYHLGPIVLIHLNAHEIRKASSRKELLREKRNVGNQGTH